MKIFAFFIIAFLQYSYSPDKNRHLEHNGSRVMTTFEIDQKFIGIYKGDKQGYLQLDNNGSGVYRYDYAGLSQNCSGEQITFKWGFILDEEGKVLKLKKPYGYSYPIIYNCSGENAFQGCTKRSMVDFILVYDDGTITVSSSDNWVKSTK